MKTRYLIALSVFISLLMSCARGHETEEPIRDNEKVCIELSINSFSGQDNTTSTPKSSRLRASSSVEDNESLIEEVRIVGFYPGEATSCFNLYFDLKNQAYNPKKIKFVARASQTYDLYVLANESATNERNSTLSFLNKSTITRDELLGAKVATVGVKKYKNYSGVDRLFMMTATYLNVDIKPEMLSGGDGTENKPFKLDLSEYNKRQYGEIRGRRDRSGIELIRSLAKIEVILKDYVKAKLSIGSDGNYKYTYDWVLPLGYSTDNYLRVLLYNYPSKYPLFPIKDFSTQPLEVREDNTPYRIVISSRLKVDENYVVKDNLPDEIPLGSIFTCDYKLVFYVPETLLPESCDKYPRINIQCSRVEDPDKFVPKVTGLIIHYDNILYKYLLTGGPYSDCSMYRNICAKVKVTFKRSNFGIDKIDSNIINK